MKLDIFALSDIHGHASEAKEALKNAGFDRNNPKHLLVVLGDYFDRGRENKAVYNYLDSIKNKVLIRGNHDDALDNAITNGKLTTSDHMNGMERTIVEFFRSDYFPEHNLIYIDETSNGYKELTPFLAAMRDYFETEHYVFTHGWLPLEIDIPNVEAIIHPDWKYDQPSVWRAAHWKEWNKVYHYRPKLEGKTVVVGHRSTSYASEFDPMRGPKNYSIFYGEGTIAIDALTVNSGRVNVLVIRDEEVPNPITHEMKLLPHPFKEIKSGRKTVEMRLFDEKRQKIRVGDKIIFTSEENGEKLNATVVGLHRFSDFMSLADSFIPKRLGFADYTPKQIANIMTDIYTAEQVEKYGALAIRISLDPNQL